MRRELVAMLKLAGPVVLAEIGWMCMGIVAAVFTSAVAVLLFAVPRPMLHVFTFDPQVLCTGAALLAIAAAFQLFDGTHAVATGALRGVGDTRTPMMMNVIGHWVLGLPAWYVLCF